MVPLLEASYLYSAYARHSGSSDHYSSYPYDTMILMCLFVCFHLFSLSDYWLPRSRHLPFESRIGLHNLSRVGGRQQACKSMAKVLFFSTAECDCPLSISCHFPRFTVPMPAVPSPHCHFLTGHALLFDMVCE